METGKVTAADVARLAGVTRATVSNWRRRHADFPAPSGGTEASPTYDLAAVEHWLTLRDRLPERSPEQRLWRRINEVASGDDPVSVVMHVALFLLYLHRGTEPWHRLTGLSDTELAAQLPAEIACVTGKDPGRIGPREPALLRELAGLVERQGARPIFESLLGHYLEGGRASVTPEPVADLMLALADPAGAVVVDPACGTGALLTAAWAHGATRVVGQERSAELALLAAVRVGLTMYAATTDTTPDDDATSEVVFGDSLRDDRLGGLRAGAVVCDPPFGDRDWGNEELAYDTRWEYGLPPRSEPELAWVQHALAHLAPGGRAVLLMPPVAASRGSGRRIRAELLRRGALRAVVALPPGVAPPYNIGLHLWVLARPADQAPQLVLFVDATETSGSDWAALQDEIVGTWRAFATEPELRRPNARAVPIVDLLDDFVDVTPARHLAIATTHQNPQVVAKSLAGTGARLRSLLTELPGLLPGSDWNLGTPEEGGWRTVTVADLSRSGGLRIHRAAASAPRPDETAADGVRVLTLSDVTVHSVPSGVVAEQESGHTAIQPGDVVLPAVLTGRFVVRVASTQDEGALLGRHLHLLRPDPDRLDPWFLAGFLAAPANARRAGYGSTLPRLDVRRLEVPLLPPDQQRGYAEAFRRLDAFEEMARRAVQLGTEVTGRLRDALTDGALYPPP